MEKVFLTESIHPNAVRELEKYFEVIQAASIEEDEIIKQAGGCKGMLIRSAHITKKIMEGIPELTVIAKHGMGVDNIDVGYATEHGIQVVNAPNSNLNAVAEHVVMLLLSLSKRVVRMDKLTRNGQFCRRNEFTTIEMKNRTVGMIGMGKIARLIVKKLSGFEVNVIAADPYVKQEAVAELGVRMVSPEEVFQTADFVIVHTVLTEATFHLVGADQFGMMKKTAYVINACRGQVIDETALAKAVEKGIIAGAGLDVFEQEPPEPDNPLMKMDSVILSPHNAALCDGALLAMAMDSAQGIIECLNGWPVTYAVNKPSVKG